MTEINDDMIAIWRENYGLNGRTPMEAMDYWLSGVSGMAPAGAVCALGMALDHIEQLRAEIASHEAMAEEIEKWYSKGNIEFKKASPFFGMFRIGVWWGERPWGRR